MIKCGVNDPENYLLVAGLSEENIQRLKNDQPIKASLRSFGVNLPGNLGIVYGKTEHELAALLKNNGLISSDTVQVDDDRLSAMNRIKDSNPRILICTVGLPRSGKTTWAKTQAKPIVNPDSVRLAIHGQRFIASAEPFVWATVKAMVKSLFLAGHDIVILDACNVSIKRRAEWISDQWSTFFQVIDTDPETCLERAASESDEAIMPIISKMANNWRPLQLTEMRWP